MALQQAWYKNSMWVWLLFPFMLLFWCISTLRRVSFRLGLLSSNKPNAFVIIVGNISVGGNGKTPTVIAIAEYLQKKGHRCGVLSRGYGGSQTQFPHLVEANDKPALVGDEPALMQQRLACPVVIDPKRVRGAKFLHDMQKCDVIICDDGLQHYALQRNFEIAVMDRRGVGNGFLMPMGPLRESVKRLNSVDSIVFNGAVSAAFSDVQTNVSIMHLEPTHWVNVKTGEVTTSLEINSAIAIAGIGDPQRFFDTLSQMGIECKQTIGFPDHYAYEASDIPSGMLLMTEKDAVKCKQIAHENCWYLQVNGLISDNLYQQIDNKLTLFKQND